MVSGETSKRSETYRWARRAWSPQKILLGPQFSIKSLSFEPSMFFLCARHCLPAAFLFALATTLGNLGFAMGISPALYLVLGKFYTPVAAFCARWIMGKYYMPLEWRGARSIANSRGKSTEKASSKPLKAHVPCWTRASHQVFTHHPDPLFRRLRILAGRRPVAWEAPHPGLSYPLPWPISGALERNGHGSRPGRTDEGFYSNWLQVRVSCCTLIIMYIYYVCMIYYYNVYKQ